MGNYMVKEREGCPEGRHGWMDGWSDTGLKVMEQCNG